ncbi:hypothetical protein DK28_0202790 [Peptococcaceae bacterium SCADC1_2_3]|nr:hypothetical protein DK28_0202790 [Peptococcaceae bacterium SCADC1_2_3]KFI34455.1 hypothetical protein HY00_01860 [Peptococcaceae bacterium SCADC1_2_3]
MQLDKNLHLIVNNSRFLILLCVQVKNLASKILSLAVQKLPEDWDKTYGYWPVLLETFVEKDRFAGTCYKAVTIRDFCGFEKSIPDPATFSRFKDKLGPKGLKKILDRLVELTGPYLEV